MLRERVNARYYVVKYGYPGKRVHAGKKTHIFFEPGDTVSLTLSERWLERGTLA